MKRNLFSILFVLLVISNYSCKSDEIDHEQWLESGVVNFINVDILSDLMDASGFNFRFLTSENEIVLDAYTMRSSNIYESFSTSSSEFVEFYLSGSVSGVIDVEFDFWRMAYRNNQFGEKMYFHTDSDEFFDDDDYYTFINLELEHSFENHEVISIIGFSEEIQISDVIYENITLEMYPIYD